MIPIQDFYENVTDLTRKILTQSIIQYLDPFEKMKKSLEKLSKRNVQTLSKTFQILR